MKWKALVSLTGASLLEGGWREPEGAVERAGAPSRRGLGGVGAERRYVARAAGCVTLR
jgi:hypothetical protein